MHSSKLYEERLNKARAYLIGCKNIYGTVVDTKQPEYISSDNYDTILIFDDGFKVRWKAICINPLNKQDYYQSNEHNLIKPKYKHEATSLQSETCEIMSNELQHELELMAENIGKCLLINQ